MTRFAPESAPNRASATIFSLSILTLVLGFAVQVVLAAKLGTGRDMDIYLVAITLPTTMAVLAISFIPSALVPLIKERMGPSRAHELPDLFRSVTRVVALGALSVTVLLVFAAGWVVQLIAPGFDTQSAHLTSTLLRFMLIGGFFDALRGVQTAGFYAQERFWLPQTVPSLNHAVMLASVLLLLEPLGLPGLALGWTLGSFLMFIVLLPGVVTTKHPHSGTLAGNRETLRPLGLLVPALMVALLGQATPLVDRLIASSLPEGAISYLGYGSKMLEIMMRTAPMAIVLAVFPRLSGQAAGANWEAFSTTVVTSLRRIILAAVPLAIAVALLREPLVTVLFQRGAFDQRASVGVATAVGWYALAFLPAAIAYFLSQAVYATKRAWTLARVWFGAVALNVVLDLVLAQGLGFAGIAIAYLIVSFVLCGALAMVLRNRPGRLRWRETGAALAQSSVAGIVMAAIIVARLGRLAARTEAPLAQAISLALIVGVALSSYIAVLVVVRNRETRAVLAWLREALTTRDTSR